MAGKQLQMQSIEVSSAAQICALEAGAGAPVSKLATSLLLLSHHRLPSACLGMPRNRTAAACS